MDEAHIQHPVRLVQHHGPVGLHPDRVALHVVGEPARCGHNDLGTLFQRLDLPVDGGTAIQAHGPDAGLVGTQHPQLIGDLNSQFPGGGQNHRLHAFVRGVDMLHDGNAVGKSLTGAGRGLGHHIPPFQHGRDAAGLHRGGLNDIALQQSAQNFGGQLQAVEPNSLSDLHGQFPHICT